MARQDVVRALVPRKRLEEIVGGLEAEPDLELDAIEVDDVEPGAYRDAQPDREVRELVRVGKRRTAMGAAVGAVLGIAIALIVPVLREWAPISVLLFAFGGGWAAAAVVAMRTVQLHRDEGDRPEKIHHLGADDAAELQLVTVRSLHDRTRVADHLSDQGLTLLDTDHPRVGDDASGARPTNPDSDGAGPPAG